MNVIFFQIKSKEVLIKIQAALMFSCNVKRSLYCEWCFFSSVCWVLFLATANVPCKKTLDKFTCQKDSCLFVLSKIWRNFNQFNLITGFFSL